MVEGDPVEWTFYGDIDWMGGDIVDNVISDYSREKGGTVYEYGYVPTNLIIEKLTPNGWHRFNYYLTKYDIIPVIKC